MNLHAREEAVSLIKAALAGPGRSLSLRKYSDEQERDENGRFGSGSGGSAAGKQPSGSLPGAALNPHPKGTPQHYAFGEAIRVSGAAVEMRARGMSAIADKYDALARDHYEFASRKQS